MLSKEEILGMEAGPELDRLVAEEVMGWKIHCRNTAFYVDADKQFSLIEQKRADSDWSPSRLISQSWEVVEKMVSLGYHYCFNILHNNRYPEPVRHACFSKLSSNFLGDPLWAVQNDYDHYHARTKSVTESICKAALLSKLEEG